MPVPSMASEAAAEGIERSPPRSVATDFSATITM